MADVKFETLKAEIVDFGNNNFIEVARKKAITSDGSNEFLAVSRGFYAPDGSKRFKKSFTIPDDDKVINFIVDKLPGMHQAGGESAEEDESEEKEE
ncbi:MAG: hypothetical protein R6U26_00735 [Candidatus Undinarchaeales archaeon]